MLEARPAGWDRSGRTFFSIDFHLLARYLVFMKTMTVQQFASMGGKARAKKLSKKRRREIAKKAVAARIAKAKK
jgi:hypothetical protein